MLRQDKVVRVSAVTERVTTMADILTAWDHKCMKMDKLDKTIKFLLKALWTPTRRIHWMWTPRSLSAEMSSPWSTEDPNFTSSMSYHPAGGRGFSVLGRPSGPTLLPAPCAAGWGRHCWETLVSSSSQRRETCPVQSELYKGHLVYIKRT